ncbi:acyl-CoA N-acyltransferase [Emericellopsis atlantica]|uniref:Acyl-CoA N-acyltransferase n=1 Tax=Emericellopsis atlantica TaxID=2614577 RepID=A0A9P7ZV28_9HYPO|nr:acyl-CoA N-acyltransferase [Emericellopsis atlantica]KAG9258889.1 acyl-CoA N-acyltransferase [Emericellopsis atlantica]
MAGELQFRVATVDDAEPLRQLIEAAFRAEDSREGWVDNLGLGAAFRLKLDVVLGIINDADSDMLMAFDNDGTLLGTVTVAHKGPGRGRIIFLAIQKEHQQGGLGRKILAHAEDYGQQRWGITRFGLNALSARTLLISWYTRRGYAKTGETTPFPRDALPDSVAPEDLYFVEMEKIVGPES